MSETRARNVIDAMLEVVDIDGLCADLMQEGHDFAAMVIREQARRLRTQEGERVATRCPHCAKPYTWATCSARSPGDNYECTLAPSHAGEHMAEGPNGHVHRKWS